MLEALVYNRLYEVGYNISFVKDLIICWTTKVTAEAVLRQHQQPLNHMSYGLQRLLLRRY